MQARIPPATISQVLTTALSQPGLITPDDTAVIFYDLSFLTRRIEHLIELFPPSTPHTIAVKANPLPGILIKMAAMGVGAEVASLPELVLAEKAGFAPDKIVFDSPIKTIQELEYALALGVHVNADSFAELERIAQLQNHRPSRSSIGVRINPQVGAGRIAATSVAGDYSKFGIALTENRENLIAAFLQHEWLTGIHLHIGSQGCDLPLLLDGMEKVLMLVQEINARLASSGALRRIGIFDMGGGLPVSYGDTAAISMAEYRAALGERFPALFSGQFRLITEFGRYVHANAGWVASRVEYVKNGPNLDTAMVHVGADLFLRKCYNPGDWHHDISLMDPAGALKTGRHARPCHIAGPLCFAGDIIARELDLPPVVAGDLIVIHDTGAYTLSMWSRYNSRQMPKVIGYYDDGARFEVLKPREQAAQLWDFWR